MEAFATTRGRERVVAVVLVLPGRSALLLAPPPSRLAAMEEAVAVVRCALGRLQAAGILFAQALAPPEWEEQRKLLSAAGFEFLTRLLYLERDARYPWVDPPPVDAVWLAYEPSRHGLFAEVVAQTYEQSLDCPEIAARRTVEDALASHRASGPFDPALWELIVVDGEPAGCVLLAAIAHGAVLDVVYTGVAARWRGRGLGGLLLRRALARARGCGAERVTLAVDRRNAPALRLYERYAFRGVAERDAWWCTWE